MTKRTTATQALMLALAAASSASAQVPAGGSVQGNRLDTNLALTAQPPDNLGLYRVVASTDLHGHVTRHSYFLGQSDSASSSYSIPVPGDPTIPSNANWGLYLVSTFDNGSNFPEAYELQVSTCINCTSHPLSSYVSVTWSACTLDTGSYVYGCVDVSSARQPGTYVDVSWRYVPVVVATIQKEDSTGTVSDPAFTTLTASPPTSDLPGSVQLGPGYASTSVPMARGYTYTVQSSSPGSDFTVQWQACTPSCGAWTPGTSGSFNTPSSGGVTVHFKYTQSLTTYSVAAVSPMMKVQPTRPPPYTPTDSTANSHTAVLRAARNEFEPFQIVMYNGTSADVTGMTITADALTGPGTIAAANVRLYKVGYYNMESSTTNAEGISGFVPDPLIPNIDEGYNGAGQTRQAFSNWSALSPGDNAQCLTQPPCNRIPPGQNRVVWVDIFVPSRQADNTQTPKGLYQGTITVSSSAGSISISVQLTVRDFEIPSTSSLKNLYDLAINQICLAHTGIADCNSPQQMQMLAKLYGRMLLDHRISSSIYVLNGFADPVAPNWSGFHTAYDAFINGSDPTALLAGSQPSTIKYPWVGFNGRRINALDPTEAGHDKNRHDLLKQEFSRQTFPGTRPAQSWFDRTVDYICDEPHNDHSDCWWGKTSSWPTLLHARSVDAPGYITLATTSFQEVQGHGVDPASGINYAVADVGIIAPLVSWMDDKDENENHQPNAYKGNQQDYYRTNFISGAANKQLWWYQSCSLQGCAIGAYQNASNPAYYNNWPSLRVDAPTSYQHRAQQWLSWSYGIQGEYYFDAVSQLPTAWHRMQTDPVSGLSGSGDGTLMYPGTPNVVANGSQMALKGTSDVPIASIRLKMIREGLEDFEYLSLVTKLANNDRTFANKQAMPLFDLNTALGVDISGPKTYHSYDSGQYNTPQGTSTVPGMLAVRPALQDMYTARKSVGDQIENLARGHTISQTLAGTSSSTSTFRLDTTSDPAGAPLSLAILEVTNGAQLSATDIIAGAPVYLTASCPAAQLSGFTVKATREATLQERFVSGAFPMTFSETLSPVSQNIPRSATSATYTITTSNSNPSAPPQYISSFAVASLPAGVSVQSISPTSLRAGQNATLTFAVSPSAPPDTPINFTVTANGCESRSASGSLTVACASQTDVNNCGVCGNVCNQNVRNYCINGQCSPCPAGTMSCCGGDICVSPGHPCPICP